MNPVTGIIPVPEKGAGSAPLPPLSLVPTLPAPPLPEQVREYIRASKAANTLRGYQSDWRDFCAWCEGHGIGPLPANPESVATYIAECAGRLKVGTLQRRL